MRILLATSILASHHAAMVPFGWAALAAGHDVRLAASPEIVPAAARTGLPVVPVGPAIDFPARHRDLMRRAARGEARYDPKALFCDVADAMADDLVALARWYRPDAVLWDPATLAAPLAAASVGARTARCLWGVDMLARGRTLVDTLPETFAGMYRRFGLELPDDPDWWTFDPTPPRIWPVNGGNRHAVGYVPYSPNGRVDPAAFPDSGRVPDPGRVPGSSRAPGSGGLHDRDRDARRNGRPRVCLTFGSGIAMREFVAGGFAGSAVLRGVAALDAEIVVAVAAADRAALGTLPDRVRVVTSFPLSSLLPSCDAVVHHGGNGTMLTAARYGVPQIVVPYLPDLRYSAERFALTGAVTWLDPGGTPGGTPVTEESIGAAVTGALADGPIRAAASELRAETHAAPRPGVLLERFLRTAA